MKNLFKKYYRSVLRPEDVSEVSGFLANKKNESLIFSLMKPLWETEMKEKDTTPRQNPGLFERIKESVSSEKQKALQRKIEIYTWGMRAAAVLVIALIISNIFVWQQSVPKQLSSQLQTVTIPNGAKTNITLPDGSLVWLNSGSTLLYPAQFEKNRSVTLIGEAYFKVEKNGHPFIVSTNYGDIVVKGTSFNVKAYTDDNSFETTLEEGVVAFRVKNSENEVTLKPGEQVINTAEGFTIRQVETKYFTSWKEGKLLFNREPFPDFIKKLERWYNVKIQYSDPKLDEIWYTGTIEMESISEVMEMISKAAPVTYSFDNKTRIFTIKAR